MGEIEEPKKKPAARKKPVAESKPVKSMTLDEIENMIKPDDTLDFTTTYENAVETYIAGEPVKEADVVAIGAGLPEVLQLQPKESKKAELSKQAENWRLWLVRQKMTPEQFIAKYPTNKMKHFVQEIIDFNTKTGKFSI